MIVAERLAELMRDKGITQAELARRIDVSQQAIGKLVSGESRSSTRLPAIARFLGTTTAYLSGETDDPTEGALPTPTAVEIAEQLDAVMLPEIDVSFAMGAGFEIDDAPVTKMVPFSRAWLASLTKSPASQLVVARGEGDSMMPTILDQDIVIFDLSQKTLRSQDRIWVLNYGGLGMIKRLRQLPDGGLQINSDNAAVSAMTAYDDEAFVIGRVVAIMRRM